MPSSATRGTNRDFKGSRERPFSIFVLSSIRRDQADGYERVPHLRKISKPPGRHHCPKLPPKLPPCAHSRGLQLPLARIDEALPLSAHMRSCTRKTMLRMGPPRRSSDGAGNLKKGGDVQDDRGDGWQRLASFKVSRLTRGDMYGRSTWQRRRTARTLRVCRVAIYSCRLDWRNRNSTCPSTCPSTAPMSKYEIASHNGPGRSPCRGYVWPRTEA